jgi:hypothetical protein
MASTYVNDLRLNEMATGDGSGTWGTTTNTNLELIAEAFSYGTEVITTNADTHTTTIADGATDPGRSLYLKYTGTLDSACTITIGPNTVSKVWIIENGTSGSQDIILSQGSGANITIPAGDTKVVYSDGAGAGAAFFDAFASLSVVDLKVQDDLTVTGDIDVDGSAVINQYLTLKTTDDQVNGWVLYTGTTDKLEFNYNGSGNAEVVIDSTGNVGIGTAPTFTPGGSRILLQLTNGASGGQIAMGNNASESENPRIFSDADNLGFATATTGGGIFQFYTAGTEALRIDASGNVDITYGNLFTDTTSGIFFSGGIGSFTNGIYGVGVNNVAINTGGTSRMTIDSSGNVIVSGAGSGSLGKLTTRSDGGTPLAVSNESASGTLVALMGNGSGNLGTITHNGSSVAYNTTSDYRLKEDDQPMTGATERVKALRPINFAWKADGSRVDGFLAHEAQEVVPECVTGSKDAMRDEEYEVTPAVEAVRDEDGNVTTEAVAAVMGTRSVPDYQGIDQSKLVPLLTAALQEAITKIEDLTTRLETLENA